MPQMLRLTLLSSQDGRFLARVVRRGGFAFVLDYGDRRVIEDVGQRLQHGFTMWRYGKLVNVPPQDPEMLMLLADHYCREGLLVFLEEPTFERGDEAPEPFSGAVQLPEQDDLDPDADTELITVADYEDSLITTAATLQQAMREVFVPRPRVPELDDDDPTELVEDDPTELNGNG